MTHALARAVGPLGRVLSYEFNAVRAAVAREEFERNGVSSYVSCECADVCEGGFEGAEDGAADAVFLDVPEPWRAVVHARDKLRPDGRVCSYSPCIEQTQRFVER